MSKEITPLAYQTKLGNATAKHVLVLIADVCNADGFGWPGLDMIVELTEVSMRTVRRLLQVFEAIGLMERSKHTLQQGRYAGMEVTAYQIHVEMLGGDLQAEFATAYRQAQSKGAKSDDEAGEEGVAATSDECRRDTKNVAATCRGVAETQKGVAATLPPHPLLGRTVKEPSSGTTPIAPEGGVCAETVDGESVGEDGLTDGQREHLATVTDPAKRWSYEAWYREETARKLRVSAEQGAAAAQHIAMDVELPTVAEAAVWVMQECGFVRRARKRGCERDPVLVAVSGALARAVEADQDRPAGVARRMVEAWREYQRMARWLRYQYGPEKFFGLGIWAQREGWPLDQRRMAMEGEASVGSADGGGR